MNDNNLDNHQFGPKFGEILGFGDVVVENDY